MIKGKFFHTVQWHKKHGWIPKWQGKVLDYDHDTEMAIVALIGWDAGDGVIEEKFVKVTDDWVFYSTNKQMLEAFYRFFPPEHRDGIRAIDEKLRSLALSGNI